MPTHNINRPSFSQGFMSGSRLKTDGSNEKD